jgi:hypothetical protein
MFRRLEQVGSRLARVGRSQVGDPADAFATADAMLEVLSDDRERYARMTSGDIGSPTDVTDSINLHQAREPAVSARSARQ